AVVAVGARRGRAVEVVRSVGGVGGGLGQVVGGGRRGQGGPGGGAWRACGTRTALGGAGRGGLGRRQWRLVLVEGARL
ncbi:MAG: hypothetical protein ACTMKV_05125, partial [Sphingomonas parapaucimobilis]